MGKRSMSNSFTRSEAGFQGCKHYLDARRRGHDDKAVLLEAPTPSTLVLSRRQAGLKGVAEGSDILADHGNRPPGADAAIDNQVMAGHQPGAVAGQEQGGLRDVVDGSDVRQRLP